MNGIEPSEDLIEFLREETDMIAIDETVIDLHRDRHLFSSILLDDLSPGDTRYRIIQ